MHSSERNRFGSLKHALLATGIVGLSASGCVHAAPAASPSAHPEAAASAAPRGILFLPVASTAWQSGPEKAVKVAHLYGSPEAEGFFIQRMEMPPNARTPPHWHAHDETITVLSGSIFMAIGDAADESKVHEVVAGGLVVVPAGAHHFGGSRDGAILQVQGVGPFEMNWIVQPSAAAVMP